VSLRTRARNPGIRPVIENLAALLPGRFTPSPAVAACVKPALDRNRGATEAAAQTPVS
jgi:hypothetical protein